MWCDPKAASHPLSDAGCNDKPELSQVLWPYCMPALPVKCDSSNITNDYLSRALRFASLNLSLFMTHRLTLHIHSHSTTTFAFYLSTSVPPFPTALPWALAVDCNSRSPLRVCLRVAENSQQCRSILGCVEDIGSQRWLHQSGGHCWNFMCQQSESNLLKLYVSSSESNTRLPEPVLVDAL